MKLTPSQSDAVNKEGCNIIVSAGAGSGKTAVLSQRVLRKIKDGIDIRKILVLTFTNEAAGEMKNRIRKEIKKNNLKEALEYLDTAYITTFDAYALSIVRKYHYLLNISKDVKIIDTSIINLEKEKILEEIFLELYQNKDKDFLKLINDFTVRDDNEIKKVILNIKNSLDLRIDKEEYLNNYIINYYKEEYFIKVFQEYFNYIKDLCLELENKITLLGELIDEEKYQKIYNTYKKMFRPNKYEDICNISISRIVVKDLEEDEKILYEEIKDIAKKIKELSCYTYDELKNSYFITKEYVTSIIKIVLELDKRLDNYKREENAFEFNDIAKMAIKIVEEQEEIREEIKSYFNEILIDEYQDTSDLQEEFIKHISNNNVYMVGDIKQSIYRFRNANPIIFKDKYDLYKQNKGGIVIDLLENFRSRKEVLEDINTIFNLVMSEDIGGVNYQDKQAMIFGNLEYDELNNNNNNNNNNHLDILKYTEDNNFSNSEIEAFIIAKDILNKINNNYLVYDFDLKKLRKVQYQDFCLILDRGRDMPLYKKIFEYFNIPLEIYNDNDLTMENDVIILKNIIKLIIKIYDKEYDQEFNYNFVSIARSFLKEYSDNEILDIITNYKIFKTDIYKTCLELANNLELKTPSNIIEEIIDKFDFYEKLIKVGDINNTLERIDYILDLASNAEEIGFSIKDFACYLEEMISSDKTIKYRAGKNTLNCVKIMNIHKSKGLQFPICYYAGLKNKFNFKDLTKRFIYDKKYGIITPYFKEGIGTLFLKELVKNNYYQEEISEKIRLLYVALTRSKEKIIIVTPEFENEGLIKKQIDLNMGLKYRSFYDIFSSISLNLSKYISLVDLNSLGLTLDYQKINLREQISEKTNNKINFQELDIKTEIIDNYHASKTIKELINVKQKETLDFGTSLHELLELSNLKDLNINNKYINNLQNSFDLISPIIYQELEFIYKENNIEYHGIIDLMLEYQDEIKIIDYKLKNIDDEEYIKQLNVYYNYVKSIKNKNINLYLYSILDNNIKEISIDVKKIAST